MCVDGGELGVCVVVGVMVIYNIGVVSGRSMSCGTGDVVLL